jgi:hypothetical protein
MICALGPAGVIVDPLYAAGGSGVDGAPISRQLPPQLSQRISPFSQAMALPGVPWVNSQLGQVIASGAMAKSFAAVASPHARAFPTPLQMR